LKQAIISVGKFLFFLGIGIFFIWLFLRNLTVGQKRDIILSFRQADYIWIALSMALGILSHISRTWRWKMLMEPLGYNPRFTNVFFSVFIGYFANLALPRLGEISRCGVLTKYEKIPFQKSFGTVVTERAIDLVTFLILFFLNLALQFKKLNSYVHKEIYKPLSEKFNNPLIHHYLLIIIITFLVLLIIFMVVFRKRLSHTKIYIKIREIFLGFLEGLKSLAKIKKPGLFIFLSIIIWLLYFVMTYVVFWCLPETRSLSLIAGFAVFIFASIGIIIVQGGIGIYPAIVAATLSIYSIDETKGYAMGWLLWTGQTLMIIAAGLVSLALLPLINKKNNDKA
jgi:uncharacterized protein (TIRG00374 family)